MRVREVKEALGVRELKALRERWNLKVGIVFRIWGSLSKVVAKISQKSSHHSFT